MQGVGFHSRSENLDHTVLVSGSTGGCLSLHCCISQVSLRISFHWPFKRRKFPHIPPLILKGEGSIGGHVRIRRTSAGATYTLAGCKKKTRPGDLLVQHDPDSDTEDSNHQRQEHEKVSGASLSGLTKASRSIFADHSGGVEVARRCNTVRTWAGFSQQRHGGRCLERDLTSRA